MPEISIDKRMKWECIGCGVCCKGVIPSKKEDLSVLKEGKRVCKNLEEDNRCNDYLNRPFICRLYPFVIDLDNIAGADGVARPQQTFILENIKIHTECPGVGNGKRIYGNKNLQRKFEKLALEFSEKFKQSFEEGKDFAELL